MSRALVFAATVLCAASCSPPVTQTTPAEPAAETPPGSPETSEPGDPHSFAEPQRVRVTHIGADWTVDFDARRLHGAVTLALHREDPSAPLRLDTRALQVEAVHVAPRPEGLARDAALAELEGDWSETTWSMGDDDPVLGRALSIDLGERTELVRIEYGTTDGATGLQWLEPSQTAGGEHPFLYTQSQAIHARSWIPCQDTPGVRVTYDAVVRTPDELVPLMSAERLEASAGIGRFVMPQPVPSYLIALAVGNLSFEAIGRRAGVWAEPETLPRAADEFADVENMMKTAESLYGPYRWGRYDILVLPPAFPFGGMENPRLTFATPTILAGDRSLVALVAHELAHSWSGNLVTNAAWSDLWLNEGFTVYIERRIVEALYGEQRAEMEAVLGRQDLERSLEDIAPADQHLVVDLRGRDPDDGLNNIPYEKGALFLETLEDTYGRSTFDRFLLSWFREHAFSSVTTQDFVRFARDQLIQPDAEIEPPDFDAWIHAAGIGPGVPSIEGDPFARVDAMVERFESGAPAESLETESFTAHEWLRFLRAVDGEISVERLAELDDAFGLTDSGNAEVVAQWLQVSISGGYRGVDDRLERFLSTIGRRKFLIPLYRRLVEAQRREEAVAIYERARDGYHPITQASLDAMLRR